MLETLGTIDVKDIIKDLEDKTKTTYKYLSISRTDYSCEHCPDPTRKAMLGKMVTNDLAESSFAGVKSQIQTYGRIGMCNTKDISNISRNVY